MSKQSPDDLDHTDELPILLETALFDDSADELAPPEDTAEHTTLLPGPRGPDAESATTLRTELAVRAAKIEALEAQVERLAARRSELESFLEARDAAIAELDRALATAREPDTGALDRLASELADRDGRLTELAASKQRLRLELEAHTATIEELRAALETRDATVRALETQVSAQPEPRVDATAANDRLREENAALTAYIAGRRTWWDETETARLELAQRIAALERDLADVTSRLEQANALAARESSRAADLRTALVEHARRLEAAERELRSARAAEHVPEPPAPNVPPSAIPPPAAASLAAPAAAPERAAAAESPPSASFEVIAQLEGEVEFKRQQVSAQMVELRDRELRLRASTQEADSLRHELTTLRAELERSRGDIARLERVVADKDRALEARDARIATLQEEIDQRLGALQKLHALDAPPQGGFEPRAERARPPEAVVDGAPSPALICLTGEAPRHFALGKTKILIGRGAHCDLQILTHFVSREHARLSVTGNRVLIEDLGSRNGVFVNSIRAERRELRHGDIVTVGETQFRFVESLAH